LFGSLYRMYLAVTIYCQSDPYFGVDVRVEVVTRKQTLWSRCNI